MTTFVRVKSQATKHEFDVPEDDWRIKAGLFTRVKDDRYPPADSPRQVKPYIPPVKPRTASAADITEEPTDG